MHANGSALSVAQGHCWNFFLEIIVPSCHPLMFSVFQNSSTYWEGKADAESLQRVYGISFPDTKQVSTGILSFGLKFQLTETPCRHCMFFFVLFCTQMVDNDVSSVSKVSRASSSLLTQLPMWNVSTMQAAERRT